MQTGVRDCHPEYSEIDVDVHFVEMNYGQELEQVFCRRLEGGHE